MRAGTLYRPVGFMLFACGKCKERLPDWTACLFRFLFSITWGERHGVCIELHAKWDYLLYKTKLPYDVNQSKQDKSNGRDSWQITLMEMLTPLTFIFFYLIKTQKEVKRHCIETERKTCLSSSLSVKVGFSVLSILVCDHHVRWARKIISFDKGASNKLSILKVHI